MTRARMPFRNPIRVGRGSSVRPLKTSASDQRTTVPAWGGNSLPPWRLAARGPASCRATVGFPQVGTRHRSAPSSGSTRRRSRELKDQPRRPWLADLQESTPARLQLGLPQPPGPPNSAWPSSSRTKRRLTRPPGRRLALRQHLAAHGTAMRRSWTSRPGNPRSLPVAVKSGDPTAAPQGRRPTTGDPLPLPIQARRVLPLASVALAQTARRAHRRLSQDPVRDRRTCQVRRAVHVGWMFHVKHS